MIDVQIQLWKGELNAFTVKAQFGLLQQVATGDPVFFVVHPAASTQFHTVAGQVEYIHHGTGFGFYPGIFNHYGLQYALGLEQVLVVANIYIDFQPAGQGEMIVDDDIV